MSYNNGRYNIITLKIISWIWFILYFFKFYDFKSLKVLKYNDLESYSIDVFLIQISKEIDENQKSTKVSLPDMTFKTV